MIEQTLQCSCINTDLNEENYSCTDSKYMVYWQISTDRSMDPKTGATGTTVTLTRWKFKRENQFISV